MRNSNLHCLALPTTLFSPLEPSNTFLEQLIPFWYYWDETRQVTKPTIAAIDGYAIGLGFQMALSCDCRIGASNTKMIVWELKNALRVRLGHT